MLFTVLEPPPADKRDSAPARGCRLPRRHGSRVTGAVRAAISNEMCGRTRGEWGCCRCGWMPISIDTSVALMRLDANLGAELRSRVPLTCRYVAPQNQQLRRVSRHKSLLRPF
jgi:hypothetical protein